MRVLVTGANGFVGRTLVPALRARGHAARVALRRERSAGFAAGIAVETAPVGEFGPDTDWHACLDGADAVVHLAARVHVARESAAAAGEFDRVNRAATECLALAARDAGARRFVFLSTVKVHGEDSGAGAFTEADEPRPADAYAVSKWRAEQALAALASAGRFEPVVLRPPLVYGPGVKANFLALLRAVERGWPLPLGSVKNRRSLVYVGNLVSAIVACLEHPKAAGRTYLVADGAPVSTPELVRRIAQALDRPARLVPVPPSALRFAGRLLGRGDAVERLLGSLAVDDGPIRRELDWEPPYSMDDGLRATAEWFRSRSGR